MKQIIAIAGLILLLSGCGNQQTAAPTQKENYPSISQNQPSLNSTEPQESPIDNECTLPDERERLVKERDSHNKQIATDTKYSNLNDGIKSIDFGKYGFKVIGNGRVEFGPWVISGGPCVFEMSTLYNLTFVETKSKDDIIKDIKDNEYGKNNEHDGLKFREVKRINDFDVVTWEEWGAYPTYQLFFEIPGKLKNIHIETDLLQSDEKDYQNIINILKSLKIEK